MNEYNHTATEDDTKKLQEFMVRLFELCDFFEFHIAGCGCCGSPIVARTDNGVVIAENLVFGNTKYNYTSIAEYRRHTVS